MRAVAIEEFGGPEKLSLMDLARPKPAQDEVLVRVVAAGVSALDCRARRGELQERLPHAFPLVPGWDLAGVVEEFGESVTRFRRGERVWGYARKPKLQWGCYAEYVSVPESSLSIMPSRLLFEEAAAVPGAGLTALQSVFGKGELAPQTTLLVLGGAGDVGHLAVQLAVKAGAKVLATADTASLSFVLGLGAAVGIDHADELAPVVRRHEPEGVDLVLDTVGAGTGRLGLELVKPGGRLVSTVECPKGGDDSDHGVTAELLLAAPNVDQLGRLARAIDRKELLPTVQKIYSLGNAAEAHRVMESGDVRGTLVLNL